MDPDTIPPWLAMNDDLWARSRQGSNAGRGFRYQDSVAVEMAIRIWRGEIAARRVVPEGLEDVSLEFDTYWLHMQTKSRRGHRGNFTIGELRPAWRHLADRLAADSTARGALVLEQPLADSETGLDHMLAEVASDDLRVSIDAAISDTLSLDDFLARTHVLIIPASPTTAIAHLADVLGLPPATCVAHYSMLRGELGRLADENGMRDVDDSAGLTVSEISRLIENMTEAVDSSALDEAIRGGTCELVDFATPLEDERFYRGIDVVVGHVVAGLPLERPDLVDQLCKGIFDRRVALAVGPSGSGKSTLIWLTAYETRHAVRWYRVRHLHEVDVAPLVRLVKGLMATTSPVGFVIDDVGRDDRAGFDHLVDELREMPDALVLGACREEDLFAIRTAYAATQVRLILEEELAERIWRELRARNETKWSEWREPYEKSEHLLLEYSHLLTEGTRLGEVIDAQVERRVREQRALELEILTLIATADAFGAEIDATRLTTALNSNSSVMKGALYRLVNEHLIRERDDSLGGLHELRSRHVMDSIHKFPPPSKLDSVRRVIDLLDPSSLQVFIVRVLLEDIIADDLVVDGLTARLTRDPDSRVLAAALHALRLAGFRRRANAWREIFDEENVSPSDVWLVTHLASNGGDLDVFPEPIQRTVRRIQRLGHIDLRSALFVKASECISSALARAPDVTTTAVALTSLAESGVSISVDVVAMARLADGATLLELRLLLEAAYSVSANLANGLAETLGGSKVLLARLERELPWVRDAHLGVNNEGRATVEAEYAYVAESVQPKPHDAVVELARFLAALAPSAEVVVCRAIDASGKPAGFGGVHLADKAIDRRGLPSQAVIAWNRACGRAAIAAVAARTETEYVLGAREIVVRAASLVRRSGNVWVRGRRPTKPLISEAITLAEMAHKLAPPPIAIETAGPLEEGELPINDPASSLGKMIANNLFVNLFDSKRVAPVVLPLITEVDKLSNPDRWRLLDVPPTAELGELKQALIDLHAVVAEGKRQDRFTTIALRAAGKNGLVSAARVCRERAATRMHTVAANIELKLSDAGYVARVVHREGELDSYCWPSDDFLVLTDAKMIVDWQQNIEKIADICRPFLADRIGFYMAPVRSGHVVASFAVKVIKNIFPSEEVRDWPELPLPLAVENLGDIVRRGVVALQEASGIIASTSRIVMHDDEAFAFDAAIARANEVLAAVQTLAKDSQDRLVIDIAATMAYFGQMVEEEGSALASGKRSHGSLAASWLAGLGGDGDDLFFVLVGVLLACTEWDVEPEGAWLRVQQSLA